MNPKRTIQRSFFEQKVGQICMYTTGTVLFFGGVIMAYFGFFAKNYAPMLSLNLLDPNLTTNPTLIYSTFRHRGHLSMQFIGPTLAAMGAFMVMMRSVSKFIYFIIELFYKSSSSSISV